MERRRGEERNGGREEGRVGEKEEEGGNEEEGGKDGGRKKEGKNIGGYTCVPTTTDLYPHISCISIVGRERLFRSKWILWNDLLLPHPPTKLPSCIRWVWKKRERKECGQSAVLTP